MQQKICREQRWFNVEVTSQVTIPFHLMMQINAVNLMTSIDTLKLDVSVMLLMTRRSRLCHGHLLQPSIVVCIKR